jgi:hypothetical protein
LLFELLERDDDELEDPPLLRDEREPPLLEPEERLLFAALPDPPERPRDDTLRDEDGREAARAL